MKLLDVNHATLKDKSFIGLYYWICDRQEAMMDKPKLLNHYGKFCIQ